jgi:hypothetical protein
MLRSKPRFKYSGLTIVMSNPSRFDSQRLLSANGGQMFDNHCLRPEYNSMQCDVRLVNEPSPLLPDTKCILLLGEVAMHKFCPETLTSNLGAMRGSLLSHKGIPCIATFLPQDAVDLKNYEKENNPYATDYSSDDNFSQGEDEDEGDTKAFGKTKRANYAFWIRADVSKAKKILAGYVPERLSQVYKIFPNAEEVIEVLTKTKNQFLWFDIETDYEEQNLQCFAFSFDGVTVYAVPILDFNYKWAYTSVHFIMRALAIAIRDNTLVAHNGANFDFFVLAHKYHIPIVKTFDTMIAHHRCFPDIEKSLGHGVSYWTWEKFHKDEDSKGYRTHEQMMARLKYCAKDVYTMYLVHQAITKYAKTIPGLETSINAAMTYIRPYLTSTLQGIKVNETKVAAMIDENDRLMMQYNRMIELLIGSQGLKDCRSVIKGKAKLFAGSNTQCCEYFHNLLGYTVVLRSKQTNKPSLGKKSLYKLALKYENPVITLVCAYRAVQKETSRLRFIPWINTTIYENNGLQESTNTIANTNSLEVQSASNTCN